MRIMLFILLGLAAAAGVVATANDQGNRWPQFRGPGGSGIAQTDFPVHFGPDSNVLWQTAMPSGNSSPCIWGDRMFLTGFEGGKLLTLAVDLGDGRILWRRELPAGHIERGARLGHPAASTPVTDGRAVYVYFGPFGLASYEFAGAERWRRPLPVPVTQHGAGSSPVLAGDRLILNCDQDLNSHLLAIDKQSGETIWKTDRSFFRRGFSTPILFPSEAPKWAVIAGTLRLVAYDLACGTERWSVSGLANEMVASPVAGDGLVFAAGWTPHGAGSGSLQSFDQLLAQGDRDKDGKLTRNESPSGPAKQHFIYIDADKDGFVTREEWTSMVDIFRKSQNVLIAVRPPGSWKESDASGGEPRVLWKQTRGLPYCPSPLYYEKRIYLIKNGGLASCFDAATGEIRYREERVGALGDYYASPVAGGGMICVASLPGVLVIYRAGDVLEILARNALDEQVIATPAIAGGKLFVRTAAHVYAFGSSETASSVSVEVKPSVDETSENSR